MDAADEKRAALRAHHALHPHPEAVTDPLFVDGDPFFDARDLVQVKYEMLRRVQCEGASVTSATQAFGLSRPAFYAAQRAWELGGLPALVPSRPGPRRAHKLGEEVVTYLAQARAADPRLRAGELAQQVQAHFGLRVHPRSIERALARRGGSRAGPAPRASRQRPTARGMTAQYEAVRAAVLGQAGGSRSAQGLAVLRQRGVPAWLDVWAACVPVATSPPPLAAGTAGAVLPGSEQDLVRVLLSMALRGRREGGR